MKVVHFTTEIAPIAKAGGLGDVLVGLSRELIRLGMKVEVILPKYDILPKSLQMREDPLRFPCMERGIVYDNKIWKAEVEGCQLFLLDPLHPKHYFQRGKIYGCEDDVARFLYFCKAGCEYLQARGEPVDVLHLHDWPTAIAAILVRDLFHLPVKKIVLTVHNAEYQGLCATWDLDALGLHGGSYLNPDKMQDDHPKHAHVLNLLKGGIVYADKVNTVSPSYAQEIMTPEIGRFLSSTFRKYQHKICGILNGIDPVLWNPKTDPNLLLKYCAQDEGLKIAKAKQAAKQQICDRFGLALQKTPWIGSITRLVPQKGPELIEAALRKVASQGATFVLLGSSPIPSLQHHFEKLKQEFSKIDTILMHFEYDEALAHQIYAALDFLVMPSRFEPCGLSQLIAMRYGTIPIVRSTGGLKDTVIDEEYATVPLEQRNGFVFLQETNADLFRALTRAFQLFQGNKTGFHALVQRVMKASFDWKQSAKLYLQMYTA